MKVSAGETAMKTCTKCGVAKAITEFPPRKNRKSKTASQCRKCLAFAERNKRQQSAELQEKARAKCRNYYAENKSAIALRVRDFLKNNPGRYSYLRKRFKDANPEYFRKKFKEKYYANPEHFQEKSKSFIKNLPDSYVKAKLVRGTKLSKEDLPLFLIEAKRDQLKSERLRRQLKRTYKEVFK